MKLQTQEEIIPIPLSTLVLTNRRIRYSPNQYRVESISLREVAYLGIVKVENPRLLTYAFLVALFAFIDIQIVNRFGLDKEKLWLGLAVAAFLVAKYYLSRYSVLEIVSTGGKKIQIKLSAGSYSHAKAIIDEIEYAKLFIE